MIGLILSAIVTIVVLSLGPVLQPSSARCPGAWWLAEGVKPDGRFACYGPSPRACGEASGPYEHVACPEVPVIHGRIYCTGGSVPIQGGDGQTVGCQMPH